MIDIETLKRNKEILSNKFSGLKIDSIFLEQNGCLSKVFYENEKLHELRSCSKILISLAIGIAINQNMLSLETSVFPVIKKLVKIENEKNIENIKNWTIKNLLTHSTGYDSQMFSEKFIKNIDKDKLLDYALNYDMPYKAGEKFTYNNVEPFIISVFFKEKFGRDISDFINENIFSKLDITDFKWDKFDKYCSGATGLYLKHTDFHKIGELILNNGLYNNVQVIPKNWIDEMCSMQLKTPDLYKEERVLPKIGAGYFIFISKNGYVFRDGANGQYIIINKEQKLLITIMSSENEMKNVTEILRDLL